MPFLACDKSTRRANHQKSDQPLAQKYFAFGVGQITDLNPRVSRRMRGGSRSSRTLRWDAVDARLAQDERWLSRTAKSCGPGAPTLALSFAEMIREAMVANKPGHQGERENKPLKPLRRKCRVFR
jgi:hypothetical protein